MLSTDFPPRPPPLRRRRLPPPFPPYFLIPPSPPRCLSLVLPILLISQATVGRFRQPFTPSNSSRLLLPLCIPLCRARVRPLTLLISRVVTVPQFAFSPRQTTLRFLSA